MAEPNVQSTVYNSDLYYTPTPLDTGIKILAFVNGESGVYDIIKTTGIPDLIKNYLTTTEIKVEQDDTIKQVAYLLSNTPIYTKRIGSMGLRQGVSSMGELLLFDETNTLLPKYYSLEIMEWLDTLEYYYIAYGATMWYTGNIDTLPEDISGRYPTKIQINAVKSVDYLVQNLYKYIGDTITILKVNGNSILCREELVFSDNLFVTIIDNANMYNKLSNVEGVDINMGEYIKLRDTVYYWQGDGTFQPTRYSNPVSISSAGKITTNYDSGKFLLKVLEQIQKTTTAYQPMPEIRGDGGLAISYKGVEGTWKINKDCETKLKVSADKKTLGIYDADDYISQGSVQLHFFKEKEEAKPDQVDNVPLTNMSDGNAKYETTANIEAGNDNLYYKVTIPTITNTFNWQNELISSAGTDRITFSIISQAASDRYRIVIKKIVADAAEVKDVIIRQAGLEIGRKTIDFSSGTTRNNEIVQDIIVPTIGDVTVEFSGCTLTEPKAYQDISNKTKSLEVKLDGTVIQSVLLDFSTGNTVSNTVIDEIRPASIGKLSIELTQATFTGQKIEKVTVFPQTDIEKNGLDLGFNFIVGQAIEPNPEGYNDATLTETQMTGLVVINEIIRTLEVSESDIWDMDMSDFELSIKGEFTAYFERREIIEKGTNTGNDIKSLVINPDLDTITYQYDFLTDAFMKGSKKNTDFYLLINNVLFYVGKYTPSVEGANYIAKLSAEPVTFSEFKQLFEEQMYSYLTGVGTYQNNYTFIDYPNIQVNGIDYKLDTVKQQTSAQFAVIQNFTTKDNLFSMSYERQTETYNNYEVYNITMGYKDMVTTYDISFDEKAQDGFGRQLYYDYVDNPYMYILKLDGHAMLDRLDTFRWGKDIKPKDVTLTDVLQAISEVPKKENLYYDFIWDTGMAHPSIAQALDEMCRQKKALNVVSLPTEYNYNKVDKSGYQKLTQYLNNLKLDSEYSRIVWAKTRENVGGNFVTVINGSTLALKQYIGNYNKSGAEFCPQMGVNYGALQANHLILPDLEIRNALIDNYRVATIKGGDGVYAYHINDNTTTQALNSPYKEEQNVRTANAIIHGAEQIFYTYLGLKNDYITRDSLRSKILEYINSRCVDNKIFKLDQVKVICDESNNSNEDIANNILNLAIYVRFGRAIKFGRIFLHSLPLDSSSTTSV